MLIDTHAHTKPISSCSWLQPSEIPVLFKNVNFDGFILSNHFNKPYLINFSENYLEQIQAYIKCHNEAEKVAKEIGIKIFFGAEAKINASFINEKGETEYYYPEFLMFGLTKEKLLRSPILYSLTQKELFEYANSENILLYQSHPYRISYGNKVADPKYMHGAEVLNAHPGYERKDKEALQFAKENNLLMSAGSDTHVARQPGTAGIIVPDFIETSEDLALFLKTNMPKNIDFEKSIIEF